MTPCNVSLGVNTLWCFKPGHKCVQSPRNAAVPRGGLAFPMGGGRLWSDSHPHAYPLVPSSISFSLHFGSVLCIIRKRKIKEDNETEVGKPWRGIREVALCRTAEEHGLLTRTFRIPRHGVSLSWRKDLLFNSRTGTPLELPEWNVTSAEEPRWKKAYLPVCPSWSSESDSCIKVQNFWALLGLHKEGPRYLPDDGH